MNISIFYTYSICFRLEDGSCNKELTEGTPLPSTPIPGQLVNGDSWETGDFSSAETSPVINKGKSLIKKISVAVKRYHSTPVPSSSTSVETPKSVQDLTRLILLSNFYLHRQPPHSLI